MNYFRILKTAVIAAHLSIALPAQAEVSKDATRAGQYAADNYRVEMVDSLKKLVKYNTVAVEGVPSTENPVHIAFKNELKLLAETLGLDYSDQGYVVVIGYGEQQERIGMIAHGDVQPVNPSKWQQSPFELDVNSEPGKLIGRGTEDDKAPIINALYAMKSIKDLQIKLNKRLELYVYMAEESDWQPLKDYIKTHTLPGINITLDSEYPVVTAEKGYGSIKLNFPKASIQTDKPYINDFSGGFFGSQIPEDAQATIVNASQGLLKQLKQRAQQHDGVDYSFEWHQNNLLIKALGKSAHSSKPEFGKNAISYLADLLAVKRWPNNTSGALVNFINDKLGLGLYGEQFGAIAYRDEFMGPMTVQATVIKTLEAGKQLNINTRRPRGKSTELLTEQIETALNTWQASNKVKLSDKTITVGTPFVQTKAPHIPTLLSVFSHYTGIENAKPIAIGGGTNSRLFPNAVSFGPTMPDKEYTGHSEHEFITVKQFMLNLKMYTAVLVELAADQVSGK